MGDVDYTKISIDDEIDRILSGRQKQRPKKRWVLRLLLLPLQVAFFAALPFWALVRGAVDSYQNLSLGTWPSVLMGVLAATLVLTVYGAVISKKFTGKMRLKTIATRVGLPTVTAFAIYSLIYLSGSNAKTPAVRDYYTSLHPLMRVAASTIILFDREIMITDLGRTREDYLQMGLTPRESSWHYRQDDGFVHALDLRTIGRSATKNFVTKLYFDLMGFRTLRHVGTADHLHVSLPTNF